MNGNPNIPQSSPERRAELERRAQSVIDGTAETFSVEGVTAELNGQSRSVRVVNVRGINKPEDRARICYVGREFAGWAGHILANPFKPKSVVCGPIRGVEVNSLNACLDEYRAWLAKRPILEVELAFLWSQCDEGFMPLGCWCCDTIAGDGSPCVCHAQVLAEMLRERFVKP